GSSATNSNLSSAARTMSMSAILSMVHQGRGWKGYDGFPAAGMAKGLVVGDDLVEQTKVLVNTQKEPETAHNALNAINYTGVKSVEHWALMPTSDFMMRFATTKDNPGWLVLHFEKGRSISYASPSGERYIYGYAFSWWFGGISPYEYLTNRAAEA